MSFSDRLRKSINDKGLRPASVCRKVNLPVQTMSSWLRGKQPRNPKDVLRVCNFLGITMDYLFSGVVVVPNVKEKINIPYSIECENRILFKLQEVIDVFSEIGCSLVSMHDSYKKNESIKLSYLRTKADVFDSKIMLNKLDKEILIKKEKRYDKTNR